jgi:exopolysaccharide biosynthesis polyprenyl glycosylphosphotransferase
MPQTNEQSIWVRLFAQVADIVMTVVSFVTAFALRSQIRTAFFFGSAQSVDSYYNVLAVIVVIWWFLLDIQKAYTETRRVSVGHDFRLVSRTAIIGTLVLLAVAYALRIELPPRGAIGLFVFTNIALLCLNRVFFRFLREYLREEGALSKTILIVGAGEKAQRFLLSAAAHAEWGINLVGFIELDHGKVGRDVMGAKVLGTEKDLPAILHQHPIHEVVFAVSTRQLEECTDMLALCEQEGVNAVILSNFFSSLVAQVDTDILYDQPVLIYRTTRHKEWQLMVKRAFDLFFAAIMLLLLVPVMSTGALLIKLQDGGPVLFWQPRVGRWGKQFRFPKFRSMVVNADELKAKLMEKNEMVGAAFKMKDDPRVTKLGRFLRKYSLDELPQLWSVLRGDMSVVGPRPQVTTETNTFESWHRRKLSVKPGLTCLWQVSGRSSISSFDEWVRLDLAYIDNWSLWLDFKILAKTIPAVLSGRGSS